MVSANIELDDETLVNYIMYGGWCLFLFERIGRIKHCRMKKTGRNSICLSLSDTFEVWFFRFRQTGN
ncbi:conserved domain protein [Bacteroides clarus YIT 12056]|uniref:Conserved domain protein n=1 Tax=Bacteroides clarus YIT 12056 TaxID=762984 RepID=A0ABN0CKB2_9BACE|nr:conserved domain protein [Bacteroides clarus YIT 12056]